MTTKLDNFSLALDRFLGLGLEKSALPNPAALSGDGPMAGVDSPRQDYPPSNATAQGLHQEAKKMFDQSGTFGSLEAQSNYGPQQIVPESELLSLTGRSGGMMALASAESFRETFEKSALPEAFQRKKDEDDEDGVVSRFLRSGKQTMGKAQDILSDTSETINDLGRRAVKTLSRPTGQTVYTPRGDR